MQQAVTWILLGYAGRPVLTFYYDRNTERELGILANTILITLGQDDCKFLLRGYLAFSDCFLEIQDYIFLSLSDFNEDRKQQAVWILNEAPWINETGPKTTFSLQGWRGFFFDYAMHSSYFMFITANTQIHLMATREEEFYQDEDGKRFHQWIFDYLSSVDRCTARAIFL